MEFIAKDVGVDAGLIMISDESYYDKYEKDENPDRKNILDIDTGTYQVEWKIGDTWIGGIEGKGTVLISSGKMVVSDPCYWIENWREWLDDTDYGKEKPYGTIIIDKMGGDGVYNVELYMEKV